MQLTIPQPQGTFHPPHFITSFKQKSLQRAAAPAGWDSPGCSKCSLQEKALGMLDSRVKPFPFPVNPCSSRQALSKAPPAHGMCGCTLDPCWPCCQDSNNPTLGITAGSRVPLPAEQRILLHEAYSKPGDLFSTFLRKCDKMCSSPGFHSCRKLDVLCRSTNAREIPEENHFCQN